MEKRLGSSAGILALVVLVLHTMGFLGSEPSDSKKSGPDGKLAAAPKSSGLKDFNPPGPWRATKQYFHSEDNDQTSNKECEAYLLGMPKAKCSENGLLSLYGFEPGIGPNSKDSLQYLIATVPDPLHTRLAVETDRVLDAIQQAAFRSDWELATQWLPWTAKAAIAETSDSAGAETGFDDVEKLPGLLLFRHHFKPDLDSDQILLVFVVGETPTAGINGFQFEAARRTEVLLGDPARVAIAGPNISGSFPSLTRLLARQPGVHHFEIRAGSVSNSNYAAQMLEKLEAAHFEVDSEAAGQQSVTFHGSTLPSRSFHDSFVSLATRLHLRTDEVAELNEDETGFSYKAAVRKDPFPIPTFRYPRDIAQLRNSYNDAAFRTGLSPKVQRASSFH